MLIRIDRNSHVPVYLQIQESVRRLISQGVLRAGQKLPSTRELARNLGVNRITIDNAYRRLEAEGLIFGRVGQGTFVNRAPSQNTAPIQHGAAEAESLATLWRPLFVDPRAAPMSLPAVAPRHGGRTISFVYAAPPPDLFPSVEFRRCVDHVLKKRVKDISRLGSSDGLASLKSYLVRWFAQNGISASEADVTITTGCQQSLDLIRKILVAPGDSLLIENPTYPGAVGALTQTPSGRMELPIQETGIDLRILRSLGRGDRCKLIYVVPNFHNPTGRTMSLDTRHELAEASAQLKIPIVEDDVFGELRYEGAPLPSLKSLSPDWVIYIGSFSKMLSPGLRLGWIVAPRPAAEQLNTMKQSSDLHTNLLMQAAMDEFCRRDLLFRHLKRMRRVFRNRRDAMAEALKRWFPSDARWELPRGGLSMWVSLPPEWNTEELLRSAQSRGVQFLPGSAFYFRSAQYNSMRLSFASENEATIQEGIRLLAQILDSQRSRPFYMGQWTRDERAGPII